MITFLENAMIAAGSIFLVYVGQDHFVATVALIIATRVLCILSGWEKKKPTEGTD